MSSAGDIEFHDTGSHEDVKLSRSVCQRSDTNPDSAGRVGVLLRKKSGRLSFDEAPGGRLVDEPFQFLTLKAHRLARKSNGLQTAQLDVSIDGASRDVEELGCLLLCQEIAHGDDLWAKLAKVATYCA